jgi:hypothetical protein
VIRTDGNLAYQSVAKVTGCEHMVAKKGVGGNARGLSIGWIELLARRPEIRSEIFPLRLRQNVFYVLDV